MSERIHTIAVDFDGTIVTHEYPDIGLPVDGALEVLRSLRDNKVKIILWTIRSDETLKAAAEWLEAWGIDLYGVNENPNQKHWSTARKVYAQLYIDDAALGCPLIHGKHERPYVDWAAVGSMLQSIGVIDKMPYMRSQP